MTPPELDELLLDEELEEELLLEEELFDEELLEDELLEEELLLDEELPVGCPPPHPTTSNELDRSPSPAKRRKRLPLFIGLPHMQMPKPDELAPGIY